MICKGAGYNTHLATTYFHGEKQPYDNQGFAKYAVPTYNLESGAKTARLPARTARIPN